jgi:uncharacterized protein involved in type VI secretion and phage assembly
MSTIIDTIQQIVRHELKNVRVTELGVVDDLFPHADGSDDDNYGCNVKLKNSGLLLRAVPVATGHIGTACIPNKGDLVLVAFQDGDVNQPLIIGRFYNDADRPPLNKADEVIFRLPLAADDDKTVMASIKNHRDNSPAREVLMEMPPKITVRMNDGTVRATAGQTEMKLDQTNESGGTVTVFAGQTKITMNQDGDVTVEAAGAMTLKANQDISIEGMNIKITAQGQVSISANMDVTVQGSLGATLDGGPSATVQGAMISVNGITSFGP